MKDDEWGTKAAAEIEKDLEEIQAEHRKITADDYIPTDEESVAEANNVSSSDVLWPFDADSKYHNISQRSFQIVRMSSIPQCTTIIALFTYDASLKNRCAINSRLLKIDILNLILTSTFEGLILSFYKC